MSIKHVAVFCGSKTGNNPRFTQDSIGLGKALAEKDIGLVFGGGSVGLMNEIANAVMQNGGKAYGVIPQHLLDMEVGHNGLTDLRITKDMHERKATIHELSDAFIALPGGFGTFEELMEIVTWSQIQIHDKPIILFNIDGYYDKLIDFIDHAINSGFIRQENRSIIKVVTSTEQCMKLLS